MFHENIYILACIIYVYGIWYEDIDLSDTDFKFG